MAMHLGSFGCDKEGCNLLQPFAYDPKTGGRAGYFDSPELARAP